MFNNIYKSLYDSATFLKKLWLGKNIKEIFSHPSTLFAILGIIILIAVIFRIRKIKFTTKLIVQIAISVALSTILGIFKIYELPQGGSVTLGAMVPILLMAIFYGPEVGFLTGFIYGIITLLLDPYILHPVQVLFDYPLPFMMLGCAGFFVKASSLKNYTSFQKFTRVFIAVIVAVLARLACHFISGVVFFADYAPKGTSPYLYSFVYNISYLGIDFVICMIIFMLLPIKTLYKTIIEVSH